jgi:hypothetical protein
MARSPEPFRIATIETSTGISRTLRCKRKPSETELNLLFVLGEHVNHVISISDVIHRMRTTEAVIRMMAVRLRRKLSDEWVIVTTNMKGFALIYVEEGFLEAERCIVTPLDFRNQHRVYFHTETTKRLQREAALRNNAAQYLPNYKERLTESV